MNRFREHENEREEKRSPEEEHKDKCTRKETGSKTRFLQEVVKGEDAGSLPKQKKPGALPLPSVFSSAHSLSSFSSRLQTLQPPSSSCPFPSPMESSALANTKMHATKSTDMQTRFFVSSSSLLSFFAIAISTDS